MEKRYLDDKYYEFSAIQDNTIIKYNFDTSIERIDKSDNFYIHLKNDSVKFVTPDFNKCSSIVKRNMGKNTYKKQFIREFNSFNDYTSLIDMYHFISYLIDVKYPVNISTKTITNSILLSLHAVTFFSNYNQITIDLDITGPNVISSPEKLLVELKSLIEYKYNKMKADDFEGEIIII